jgi:hypothetical protein
MCSTTPAHPFAITFNIQDVSLSLTCDVLQPTICPNTQAHAPVTTNTTTTTTTTITMQTLVELDMLSPGYRRQAGTTYMCAVYVATK